MDHSRFGGILRDIDALNKRLKDEFNALFSTGFSMIDKNPFKGTLGEYKEFINILENIKFYDNAKADFTSFYILLRLRKDHKYIDFRKSIKQDIEIIRFWKTSNGFPAETKAFERFCDAFDKFGETGKEITDRIDRSEDIMKSLENDFFRAIRKNHNFRIRKDMKSDGKTVSFDVPVTIRFANADLSSDENILKTINFFLKDDLKRDDELISDFILMIEYVLNDISDRNVSMFQAMYGNRISFSMLIDIVFIVGGFGSVIDSKTKDYGRRHVNIVKFDPMLRNLEMNLDCNFIKSCIDENNESALRDTIIHELNHLFDKSILNKGSDLFRKEGIARFSEAVFNKTPFGIKEKLIEKYRKNPINGIMLREDAANNPGEPYAIGAYMCYTMFIYYLSFNNEASGALTRTKDKKTDVRILALVDDPITGKIAESFIKILRNLSTLEFFSYYLKAERSEPVISPGLVRNMA